MSYKTLKTELGAHICIKLINLVKQHPVLYLSAKEASVYPRKNRGEINRIWDDIAAAVGLLAEDCKHRWKSLKDVIAKIRKRRLQEAVLGIQPRKKWIYEDIISFMTFPFEEPYRKALEDFEEVNCREWKLEDLESNDTSEELYDSNEYLESTNTYIEKEMKTEQQIKDDTTEYLDLDLVNAAPDSEMQDSMSSSARSHQLEDNVHDESQVSMLSKNNVRGTEFKPRSRYREIRPKPYQSKNRGTSSCITGSSASSTPCIVNMSSLNSSNQIITSPVRQKDKNTVILNSSNMKAKNYTKVDTSHIDSTFKPEILGNAKIAFPASFNNSESSIRISHKYSGNSSSLELFFKSMAQTVMNLPMQVQAEIKMEICKVVTRAEIQYSLSQSTQKSDSYIEN